MKWCFFFRLFTSQRLALHRDSIRVVHQLIKSGVGHCRIVDPAVPVIDQQLAGQYHRPRARAVVDPFQQVVPGIFFQRCQTPVVQDQRVNFGQLLQHAAEADVAACDPQMFQ